MARFGAVITAMVTPFDDEGALDLDVAAQLARWLADHGSDGLVVAGTTGEGSTLTDDEKLDLWRAVAEAVTIPVIANTGSNDTAHSVHLTRQAAGLGVAGVLAVTPYYNRPSQTGLEAHFRAIAAATELPVLLYDIPVRSGRKISHEVMVRLAVDVPNMAGVKDAAADVAATARLIAAVPERFEVYSGNDDHTLAVVALGGVGVVSVAGHWVGAEM
ncbi:MAG TPA: 4-hydroxy-tetrahydrodipicolinate synthase, partial [Acidimicrobiales bacterium]|nr:4-hydroxy-tetrahydrodipicolinate synthase [Acidimicrobiales bacterium]